MLPPLWFDTQAETLWKPSSDEDDDDDDEDDVLSEMIDPMFVSSIEHQ